MGKVQAWAPSGEGFLTLSGVRCCWVWGNGVERPLSVFHLQYVSTRSYSDVLWALNQVTPLNVSRLSKCESVLGTKL